MSSPALQPRTRVTRIAQEAVDRARLTVVPRMRTRAPRVPFVTRKLGGAPGPVVAVSDYMKAVQQQISPWVPQRYHALGADGFGFADTRAAARRFFKVDAESVVVQALAALAEEGAIGRDTVQKALDHYRITDPTAVSGVKQEGGAA